MSDLVMLTLFAIFFTALGYVIGSLLEQRRVRADVQAGVYELLTRIADDDLDDAELDSIEQALRDIGFEPLPQFLEPHLHEPLPDDEPDPAADEFDMDLVCERLQAMGHPAFVEHTGGGCATIYAGGIIPTDPEPEWGPRYAAVAGPGWFRDGRRDAGGVGSTIEFYVGPDDDGDTDPEAVTSNDETVIAQQIAKIIDQQKETT